MIQNKVSAWQPLPGPALERVMLCGWQKQHGNTAGYWWYEEGATDDLGQPIEQPRALYWTPIALPAFPATPELAA